MAEILVLDDVLDATALIGKILAKKGHTVHPGMHAIMLTGSPTVKTAREAISLGADEYCVKPIDGRNSSIRSISCGRYRRSRNWSARGGKGGEE